MSFDYGVINERLVCFVCGVNFEQQELLKSHLSDHSQTSETFDENPYEYLGTELNENKLSGDEVSTYNDLQLTLQLSSAIKYKEMHVCSTCGREFKRKDHLQKHSIIHSKARPFPCLVCGKSFARKDRLKQHCVIHLSNGWSCYFCGKMFSQRCILRKHEMIHRGVKPFSCELCDRKFSRKNDLLRHSTIHSGEKAHLCEECGKGFSQKRLLKRHLNIHKKI